MNIQQALGMLIILQEAGVVHLSEEFWSIHDQALTKELEKIRELSDNLIGYIQAIDENNYSENLTKGNQVSE